MNYRLIARYLRFVLQLQAVFLLPMLAYSVTQGEHGAGKGFLITLVIVVILSLLLRLVKFDPEKTMYIKDGFVMVAICWIAVSVMGAFPYWISGDIPFFLDALFESVSGFTTTGATILTNVEGLSSGLLLWRGFSHWIGGMGVLVFLLALVPALSGGERSFNVMKAESTGPAPGKLVPKLRQSAKLLYIIYLVLTLILVLFLLAGGMPLLDSVVNAMSTAGTGGFSARNISIEAYNSAYLEMVIAVFLIIFGISFNMYYFLVARNFSAVYKNEELRVYLGIILVSTILVAVNLLGSVCDNVADALRYAFFQVSSTITTTCLSSTNYDLWPTFSRFALITLTFIGASAGSTGGGIKVSRIIILFKESRRILFRMVHPRSVETVKMDGKTLDKTVVHSVSAYLALLMMILVVSTFVVAWDGYDLESTFTAVSSCLNNNGPGLGLAGPAGNFSSFSPLSKVVLSLNMLIGRLEIYPVLLMFSPRTWKRI